MPRPFRHVDIPSVVSFQKEEEQRKKGDGVEGREEIQRNCLRKEQCAVVLP